MVTMQAMDPKAPSTVKYEPVLYDETVGTKVPLGPDAPQTSKTALPWRPFYLRRSVLLGFFFTFFAIVITVEALFAASSRNSGIATSTSNSHFLWSYGPTAFLVATAAAWSHAEYQSKLTAPWLRLAQPAVPASRSLLLDYLAPLPPVALFSSLRNRDFVVAIALTVTILLKGLVIMSTGLISESYLAINETNYPMVLPNSFINNNSKLSTTGDVAWYIMQGLANRNLSLPEGISSEYAYQSIQVPSLSETAELQATVDGFSNWLNCEAVDLSLSGAQPPNPHVGPYTLNVTLGSSSCNVSLARLVGVPWPYRLNSTYFLRLQKVQCDGTTDDNTGSRILMLFGNITYVSENIPLRNSYTTVTVGSLPQTAQLLCKPAYAINKVNVVRNGTVVKSVSPDQDATNRTLSNVSGWDIANAVFKAASASFLQDQNYLTQQLNVTEAPANVDVYTNMMLATQGDVFRNLSDLFNDSVLQATVQAYYKQVSAVIAKQSLMETSSTNIVGSIVIYENRHIVGPWVAHWMAGLAAACAVLTAAAIFLVPKKGILPTSPSTLLGSTLLLLYSDRLLNQLRYAGSLTQERLSQCLGGESTPQSSLLLDPASREERFAVLDAADNRDSKKNSQFPPSGFKPYQPLILHPASRTAICTVIVGLMITLELLLRKSNKENGLGTIPDNSYIHYAWTASPALVFALLTTAVSTVDSNIRTLTPYMSLKQYALGDVFTQLDLVDTTVPEAIFKEVKFGATGALATTVSVLIASFFTIFSSSLYIEAVFPITASTQLRANQSYTVGFYIEADGGEAASLILESNFSFPQLTYDDMVFPQFVLDTDLPASLTESASAVSISAVVPAVRGIQDCRMYNQSQIIANVTTTGYTEIYNNPLFLHFDGEDNCNFSSKYDCRYSTYSNMSYFGMYVHGAASDRLFTWGRLDYNATPIVQHVSAMGCNTTMEVVDVNVTFTGTSTGSGITNLTMDVDQNPPQPLEDTARVSDVLNREAQASDIADVYGYLTDVNVGTQMLDPFFGIVVTSPWAAPLSALGNGSAAGVNSVATAVRKNHGIIQAQWLAHMKVPANETNGTLTSADFEAGRTADSDLVYNATATVSAGLNGGVAGTRRVVQDAVSTHVLTAMLGATVAFFVLGWATTPHTNVLPRSPTSIASVAALIAGGNLAPRLAATLAATKGKANSSDMVAAATAVPGRRFWLGWGALPTEGTGERQFGIFVVDEEETSRPGQARARSGTVSSYGSKQSLLSFGK